MNALDAKTLGRMGRAELLEHIAALAAENKRLRAACDALGVGDSIRSCGTCERAYAPAPGTSTQCPWCRADALESVLADAEAVIAKHRGGSR